MRLIVAVLLVCACNKGEDRDAEIATLKTQLAEAQSKTCPPCPSAEPPATPEREYAAVVLESLARFVLSHQVEVARALHASAADLTDDQGNLKPEMLEKFMRQFFKDYGCDRRGYEIAVNTFGSEVAKPLFAGTYGQECARKRQKH